MPPNCDQQEIGTQLRCDLCCHYFLPSVSSSLLLFQVRLLHLRGASLMPSCRWPPEVAVLVGGLRRGRDTRCTSLRLKLILDRLAEHKTLGSPVNLGPADSLKVILTTQETRSAKRPHQAFLLLKDTSSNLDISYPFNVKENGKAKVELVSTSHLHLDLAAR